MMMMAFKIVVTRTTLREAFNLVNSYCHYSNLCPHSKCPLRSTCISCWPEKKKRFFFSQLQDGRVLLKHIYERLWKSFFFFFYLRLISSIPGWDTHKPLTTAYDKWLFFFFGVHQREGGKEYERSISTLQRASSIFVLKTRETVIKYFLEERIVKEQGQGFGLMTWLIISTALGKKTVARILSLGWIGWTVVTFTVCW